MISARYAIAVCVLALVALVPTVIHSYAGVVVDDGRKAASVPTTLAGYSSTPSERNATWGQRRFESNDWVERKYTNGAEHIVLTVVRSYELTPLYHHPELAVAYSDGHSFEPARTQRFAGHDDVPVHVLRPAPPDSAAAMYVLETWIHPASGMLTFALALPVIMWLGQSRSTATPAPKKVLAGATSSDGPVADGDTTETEPTAR